MPPSDKSRRRYALYVLGVLSAINLINYADRQIMFGLYPYVQDELGFSDFQLGLLGSAFLIVHSIFSIPGGLLADRWLRRKVIALGVGLWSIATMLGAIARGFADMFAYRALVGIGEASYHPAANAMISDYFPPDKRGRAMGVFSAGMVVGGAAGMMIGTLVADYAGWRYAFIAGGVPGLVLAVLAWKLRDGRRAPAPRERETSGAPATDSANAMPEKVPTSASAPARGTPGTTGGWRVLLRIPTVRYNVAGGICVTFCLGGLIAWTVSFLDRYFVTPQQADPVAVEMPVGASLTPFVSVAPAAAVADHLRSAAAIVHPVAAKSRRPTGELSRISVSFGIIALIAGILGSLAGGWLADRLMRRTPAGRLIVSAGGFLLGLPFAAIGIYANTSGLFLFALFIAMFGFTWYMGPSIAILHDVVPYRYRATIAAWYIFAVHLLGDAISPPIIGWLSELSNLRTALLLPLGVALVGCAFFLLGARTVARDMAAAAAQGSEEMGA